LSKKEKITKNLDIQEKAALSASPAGLPFFLKYYIKISLAIVLNLKRS